MRWSPAFLGSSGRGRSLGAAGPFVFLGAASLVPPLFFPRCVGASCKDTRANAAQTLPKHPHRISTWDVSHMRPCQEDTSTQADVARKATERHVRHRSPLPRTPQHRPHSATKRSHKDTRVTATQTLPKSQTSNQRSALQRHMCHCHCPPKSPTSNQHVGSQPHTSLPRRHFHVAQVESQQAAPQVHMCHCHTDSPKSATSKQQAVPQRHMCHCHTDSSQISYIESARGAPTIRVSLPCRPPKSRPRRDST